MIELVTAAAIPKRPILGAGAPGVASAPRGVVIGLAAFLCVYLGWLVSGWPPDARSPAGDLFFLVIDAAAVYLSWRASRRCPPSSRLRWFWRLMSLALMGQLGGDLVTFVYDVGPGPIPFPSLADPPYLALYPFMLAALLCVPLAQRSGDRQGRIALLDMATVILGGTMVIWLFALEPTLTEGGQSLLQTMVSVAYPVGDIVLVAGLAAVWLHWSPPAFRLTLAMVASGLVLFIVADVAYAHLVLHDEYASGDPIDLFWILALMLFAFAAASQPTVAEDDVAAAPAVAIREKHPSPMPFVALVVGGLSLVVAQWGNPFFPDTSLVLAALALGTLVAARQFLSQRETFRLQGELQDAHDQLAKLASLDSLTEIANRRAIGTIIEHEARRAQRYSRHLSILFLDIDLFKEVNDRAGHATGDRALREFAAVIGGELRPTDVLGRWGGEEFIAVLPEAGREEALRTAERIRDTVEGHRFAYEEGARLTCSIGVSSYPSDAQEPSALVEAADRGMYRAKQAGRNRVGPE
jgi:diguanylate cyclase (GGDEF)-like protein